MCHDHGSANTSGAKRLLTRPTLHVDRIVRKYTRYLGSAPEIRADLTITRIAGRETFTVSRVGMMCNTQFVFGQLFERSTRTDLRLSRV